MKIINEIKKGSIQAFTIIGILSIAGLAYASFDFNAQINQAGTNTTLSSTEYNKLVQKLNAIDKKQLATAWVNFDGMDCNIDSDLNGINECKIRDEFNILKVERVTTGEYFAYFKKNMLNTNYSANVSSGIAYNYNSGIGYDKEGNLLDKVSIIIRKSSDATYGNIGTISIQVFGGN